MNSIRYRINNPWGLHARSSAFVATVASTCAGECDVVIGSRGREADAKDIMGVMTLAAGYGSEIEFISLMSDENWAQFTASLESLFFVVDHQGNKANAYAPVERIIKITNREDRPCASIHRELDATSVRYNCGPFFERIDSDVDALSLETAPKEKERPPFNFERIDTFISYDSKDFSYAIRIYDALIDRGFNVFFSGASLPRTGTTDFQQAIEKALASTRSMTLVTTDPSHLEGGWVRAEWTTFLNEKRVGRKSGNLVTVRSENVAIDALPLMLTMFQSEIVPDHGPWGTVEIERLIEFLDIST